MSNFRSAYHIFYSCETAFLRVQNDIFVSLNTGHFITLQLLDLSAAFDTIDQYSS